MDQWDVVVVGGGIAGVSAVRTIVEHGGKHVLLLSDEPHVPYKRTKASKYIAEGFRPDEFQLEPEAWYARNDVTLRTGVAARSPDTSQKTASLSTGEQIRYDKLVLCPGSEPIYPRTVRPHEANSFFIVRSAADVQRLSRSAKGAKRVLVDGMGVLAVEVAYELTKMGVEATLAGATPQLMPRQLSIRAGEILEDLLTSRGIKLRFQEEILSFEPRKKGGFSVAMIRDSAAFDLVVFCIGVAPRLSLAREAGIETNTGILVDRFMQTNVADVFAAGDAAEHEDGLVTYLWHAAEFQGKVAALNAIGKAERFEPIPFRLKCEVFDTYFFSINKPRHPEDYDLDELEADGRYQCFYYENDAVTGAVMVNDADREKLYEQAVQQHWSRDRVRSDLAF